MTVTSGYSKTPLAKKLGIKEGFSVLLVNQPDHYLKLFADLPDDLTLLEQTTTTTTTTTTTASADFIHLFCTSLIDLQENVSRLKPTLKKTGMFWVSWPKGSSKIVTDLKREPVRDCLLAIGLVDIKVCAVDDDWSGLKFVYRVKDR